LSTVAGVAGARLQRVIGRVPLINIKADGLIPQAPLQVLLCGTSLHAQLLLLLMLLVSLGRGWDAEHEHHLAIICCVVT
jgi:hypothetical protein